MNPHQSDIDVAWVEKVGRQFRSESTGPARILMVPPYATESRLTPGAEVAPVTGPDLFTRLTRQIAQLAELQPGWRGVRSMAPSAQAVALARWVADRLNRANLHPDKIVASGDGDLTFYFFSAAARTGPAAGTVFGALQCSGTGALLIEMADRRTDTESIREISRWDREIDGAIGDLRRFVRR